MNNSIYLGGASHSENFTTLHLAFQRQFQALSNLFNLIHYKVAAIR
ncbi:MAG: hypothetical protein K2W99_07805 [Chthoniobacterales bacterium]|nr:hypothetical protein [Chthoniobacterales bacterium]